MKQKVRHRAVGVNGTGDDGVRTPSLPYLTNWALVLYQAGNSNYLVFEDEASRGTSD
jgi:hypothetical protein